MDTQALSEPKKIVALYQRQVWLEKNQLGKVGEPEKVDVTEQIMHLTLSQVHELVDDRDETNDLIDHKDMGHDGPHAVYVTAEICKYFGVSSVKQITQGMLVKHWAAYEADLAKLLLARGSKSYCVAAGSDSDLLEPPNVVHFSIDEPLAKEVEQLSLIVKAHGLLKVEKMDFRAAFYVDAEGEDSQEEDMDGICLNVSDTEFWYSGYLKHNSAKITSDKQQISELLEHFKL